MFFLNLLVKMCVATHLFYFVYYNYNIVPLYFDFQKYNKIFYLIPKVFGTLPFVNGLGLSILAVCIVGEPIVMICP